MLDFSEVKLNLLSLHRVGNKDKGESNLLAKEMFEPSDDLRQELMTYFLLPFKNVTETYRFRHSSDINYNTLNGICTKIFNRTDTFLNRSIDILKHLYEQSEHPNIKIGEVCVCYFTNIVYEDELLNAVGVFKSERKESFLQFKKQGENLIIANQQGVSSKKLDKGCLILNTKSEEGFRVFSIDNNNYDAEYWKNKFLDIEDVKDHNYQTKNYIALCKDFSTDIIESASGKAERISFLNQSVKYLTENETFELEEFTQTVFDTEELKEDFKKYKSEFEKNNELEIEDEFEISKPTLKVQKKKLKNLINLDNQIQIKLGFNDYENDKFIEKGYDEKKKMFFYKIYFNQETD